MAPSAHINFYGPTIPRAMSKKEIETIVCAFGNAVHLARSAGFDAVEVHCGHGYLISQFLSSYGNKRRDEFGGSLENRARFMRMVIKEVKQAAGFDMAVLVKMNMRDGFKGGMEIEESLKVAAMLEADGVEFEFPDAGYKGDYIRDIAAATRSVDLPAVTAAQLLADLPEDAPNGDKEVHIGALIERAGQLIGHDRFAAIRQQSLESIREEIEEDLREFGIEFDRWFSEQSLTTDGRIDEALAVLQDRNMLYKKDGATWFRATDYGDEKDRVVVRENGVKTYFASDIAYHFDKRKRGYDQLIDVLGSDHHGYVARVRAGLEAMGFEGDSLEVLLMQFVSLYRDGEKQSMSTRAGEFITLRQLREEVGNDAARFFYVMRSNDQPLDFDLELAKSSSNDNPVYYIQYAHARVASVFRQLGEKSLEWNIESGKAALHRLTEEHETGLMRALDRYPDVIELAANNRAPQHLVHYLRDLANEFHSYYNAHLFIVGDAELRDARLVLITAVQVVIANGLEIIGVGAPDSM